MINYLHITNPDLKRLKGPESDFIIICNKVDQAILESFITEKLIPANPNHHPQLIHAGLLKEQNGDYRDIQNIIYKIFEPKNEVKSPRIFVLPINLTTFQKITDWTHFLIQLKLETGTMGKILQHKIPILLCKFLADTRSKNMNIRKALSISSIRKIKSSSLELNYNVRISHLITAAEIGTFHNKMEIQKYLVSRLQVLEFPKNEKYLIQFNNIIRNKSVKQELISEIPTAKIIQEISKLPASNKLNTYKQFDVYITDFKQIPNTMLEIGRLRELTFRNAKEGTGLEVDLDTFDPYYKHLFIWDRKTNKIAGAYRLAEGHNIIPQLGKKGFYISTLFKFKNEFIPTLSKSVELGRSFITPEYQKSNFLLFMMWKSLYTYIFSNPENRYIIGPVSISDEYSKISRLLIMDYLKKYYKHSEFQNLVKPRKPFRLIGNHASEKILLRNFEKDIHKLDKLISEIQYNSYKLPVLLRQYLKQNAKVLAFNKDPKFHNVLDALLILDHEEMQGELTELLHKELAG
jgi:hypothetical protein